MSDPKPSAATTPSELDELTPDVFVCVSCGAQMSFRAPDDPTGESLLERATCGYCETVNDRALALLRKQHARERHEELLRRARREKALRIGSAVALALVVLLGLLVSQTHAELRSAQREVARTRAQVENVRERQEAVLRRFASAPESPAREAELSGAENRVRIERARYDEAAAAYNDVAGGPWAGLCASLFGFPPRAALSNEEHW